MLQAPSASTDLNNQTQDFVELRARGAKNGKVKVDEEFIKNGINENTRVLINHKMMSDDTLNSIALQYSVSISDIKRSNGLVNDQDIYALSNIKIPVSRMQKEIILSNMMEKQNNEMYTHHLQNASSSNNIIELNEYSLHSPTNITSCNNLLPPNQLNSSLQPKIAQNSTLYPKTFKDPSKISLLTNYESDENSTDCETDLMIKNSKFTKKTKKAIETILHNSDATVAAVRENLSEKSFKLEGGFHFINATSPDTNNSKGFWLILASLIFLFVIVPLILTFLEEEANNVHLYK